MRKCIVILLSLGALLNAGCAARLPAPPPPRSSPVRLVTHLEDSQDQAEHDEIVGTDGVIMEAYPTRSMPQRVIYRYPQGGMIDRRLMTPREWTLNVTGFHAGHMPPSFYIPDFPEGHYTLTQTDQPHIWVIKTVEGQHTVAYWGITPNWEGTATFATLEQAQAFSTAGILPKRPGQ